MTRAISTCLLLLWLSSAASAQSLGTFHWQMQPYCNVITVSVTQTSGVYTLDGFDDQCGASTRAPVTGTAVPNPNGTIELGFNIVTSPSGAPVHVAVALDIATLGGPWSDSAGNTGTFAFTPNGGTGGNPRPAPATIGAVAVDPTQVQLRVSGGCASGQLVQRINQDGSVICAAGGSSSTGIVAVATPSYGGLKGGATTGVATLGLATTAVGAFDFSNPAGFTSATTSTSLGSDFPPISGRGTRVVWYPGKAAFRAGIVRGAHWDDANIGAASMAMGSNATASGSYSVAMGSAVLASGENAIAIGTELDAAAEHAFVLGRRAGTSAAALGSFVFGDASSSDQITSYFPNQFMVRAAGGTTFYSNGALTTGVKLAADASAWSSLSDVNAKENFRHLDDAELLGKLARMPIREWNYKAQHAAIRHMGPTAQDFHAAFGLGEDPLRISTIDADGVALAGVRALALENQALKAALAELRARLERIEATR